MTKIIHMVELTTGSYEDRQQIHLGAFFTEEEANTLVEAYQNAFDKSVPLIDSKGIDETGLLDAEDATVYSYPVEIGTSLAAPILGFIAFKENDATVLTTAYFNSETGADIFGVLPERKKPPVETIQAATRAPEGVHSYEGTSYYSMAVESATGFSIQEVQVEMHLSLNLDALRKKIGTGEA